MNITIFDMDWFHKKSFIPNIDCMRLSSYHKQRGDSINFITEENQLGFAFDKMYIAKNNSDTPMPPRKLIDDSRTILLGQGFKYYGAKELNAVIVACRPDYLLYDLPEHNSYANANFITFYAGKTLIKNRQDYHNTHKHHKKTIVTDKYFWKAKDEEIIYCLEELKKDKNIVFLEPISLGKILSNTEIKQKFLELHFSLGTKFKWKNDYSSNYPEINNIISFLKELKEHTSSNIGFIPIKAMVDAHVNHTSFELDMLRCFEIMAAFKQNKLQCVFILSKNALSSPYYNLVAPLEAWSRYFYMLSYVEFVTHDICLREGIVWYSILNNPIKWKNKNIDLLLYFLTSPQWEEKRKLLFVQWGYEELNSTKLNYNKIKNNINLLYKDIDNE